MHVYDRVPGHVSVDKAILTYFIFLTDCEGNGLKKTSKFRNKYGAMLES